MSSLKIKLKRGESVRIGEECMLTFTDISGSHVSLHFSAPRTLPIVRIDTRPPQKPRDESVRLGWTPNGATA